MKLVQNWQAVLRHAWSVRFILVAGLLTGIEASLPFFPDVFGLEPGALAGITFAVVMAALIARFIAQPKVSGSLQ